MVIQLPKTFLGVENNQVLIRKYEIIGADFEKLTTPLIDKRGRHIGTSVLFVNRHLVPTLTNPHEFIDIFTLKEYFFHLLEKPVDDVTWLRIKQPGTYTIHFDLIIDPNSFSFELHTRDEVILFSEHNPKHNINLEKGENCLLVYKRMPSIISAG